jgi:hypothetical protein
VRGQKLILDANLARIYGVATKALNQAVKRNSEKFPPDFMFQLIPQEFARRTSYRTKRSHKGDGDGRQKLGKQII